MRGQLTVLRVATLPLFVAGTLIAAFSVIPVQPPTPFSVQVLGLLTVALIAAYTARVWLFVPADVFDD